MNIAILGYGVEGKSVEKYFREKGAEIQVFDDFEPADVKNFQLETFDLVFRSPSVHPHPEIEANWTSVTRYFFDHRPQGAKIIGVTGTKGKGTTCTLTAEILKSIDHSASQIANNAKTVHLIGNIGTPALDILDKIKPSDVIIYELSSFQLWDLEKSPHVAGVLRIEPDHLNVHDDFDDYVAAKSNIVNHQTATDYCIYFRNSAESTKIASESKAKKLPYPLDERDEFIDGKSLNKDALVLDGFTTTYLRPLLYKTFLSSKIRGRHMVENAEAALLLAAASENAKNLKSFIQTHEPAIKHALAHFKPLPHRLEFVRELNGVEYYDDNFASAPPALDAALNAFSKNLHQIVLIAGGKDRGLDLEPVKTRIFQAENLKKVILIGETAKKLAENEPEEKYEFATTLEQAVRKAQKLAEETPRKTASGKTFPNIVLMSPGAPSFDMFKNFEDRGDQFQKLVKGLS